MNLLFFNVTELFRLYTPNSTKAWISICDKFINKIQKSTSHNWFGLCGTSENEFKKYIIQMDTHERRNPKFV
jgi:hypothetical protein